MATKDIEVGNFYHVLVKVLGIDPKNGEITTETVNEFGTSLNMEPTYFSRCEKEAFFPITPTNGIKNSEPAPKYDPCRLFRKGDKVRVVEWNGRNYYDLDHNTKLETGCLAEISDDEEAEQQEGYVSVIFEEYIRYVPPCYLELVTPVEEQEPYSIDECGFANAVYLRKNGKTYMTVPYAHPVCLFKTKEEALAAAEAECARLNAEHRKEREK